eukprot:s2332_g7.t1
MRGSASPPQWSDRRLPDHTRSTAADEPRLRDSTADDEIYPDSNLRGDSSAGSNSWKCSPSQSPTVTRRNKSTTAC